MFFFLLVLFLFLLTWDVKFTKRDVAELFGVENRTLKKWVHWFFPKSFSSRWSKLRKLTAAEFFILFIRFEALDGTETMNKDQIAEACESDTKMLRREILSKIEKLGLTKEAYDNLSVFPPFMSSRLVEAM